MNKSKLFASLAALSMTMTQTGQIQIFAKEEALKEDALLNDSYKADLQDQILKAQNKKEETKKALDIVQKTYDDFNNETYIPVKTEMESTKNAYDTTSLQTQQAIVDALEKQVTNLETNQKELKEANEKKKVLSNALEDATKELVDAQDKLQKAQKEHDALLEGTSEEEISKDVEEKEKALAEAQKELEEAQNTVAGLTQQKAEEEAKVTEATQNVENTKNAYAEAQTSVNEAQKALDTAVANYNEKKAIYDGASDPAIKAQYEADIVNAENELVTAQTNLQVALENQTAKANAVTSAEKGLADVNQEILNLDAQIAEKQKALDVLNQTINDAENALNEAKAQLETAKANQKSKEKELETAKANLEKAKQDVTTQQSKVSEAQDAVTAQEKVVTQLRADKEQAQAKIEQGSKGFFEAYGYTDALKILEEQSTANGGSTNIGAENDATSLENFKRALSMVRYGNALRTSDTNFTGREDLKVNPTLFAISQVQINATANGKKPGHSHLYNVGENIMGSPISEDDKGLYEGWYDSEKQVYDYITSKGWTIAEVKKDENKFNEVMNAVGHSNIQVGHYIGLISSDYEITGTAYIYSKTPAPDGYRCNAGQVFTSLDDTQYVDPSTTMTIDEFEAQFNEYYNKLMNADSILKDGESKLEALKAELENQRQVLGTKMAAQTNAQTNVATVQTQVTQATNATARAEANVATKQAAFDKLCNDNTALNMAKEIVGLKTQKKQLETVDRAEAQKALENAQQEKKNADENVENKKGIVNDAQATLKKRKDILDEANKGIETAKANLDVAEKDVDAKSEALSEAKNNENTKKALYDASQATLETAKKDAQQKADELETAKAEEAKKAEEEAKKKADLETATLKQKSLKNLKTEIADTQEQIGTYQKAIEDFNSAIAKLDETIVQLENEQASIEDVKGQVEKAYEAYKKLCAEPTGFMDVVDSDNDVVLGLYSKMGSMRTAYEEYATALNVFLGVEAQWNTNKEQLNVALKAYEEADKEVANAQVSLKLYLVSQKGKGWQKMDSKWYYVDSTGRTVTNQWIGSYYFEADGTMATSKWIGNYYVDANGRYTPEQWVLTNGKYWYRHQDGSYTKNDFEVIGGQTYYFDSNGYMVNGWKQVGSDWYYFNKAGHMVKNQWIGDYYFGSDGKMVTNTWVGNYHVGPDGKID